MITSRQVGHLDLALVNERRAELCFTQQLTAAPLLDGAYYTGAEDYYENVRLFLEQVPIIRGRVVLPEDKDTEGAMLETIMVNLSRIEENIGKKLDHDEIRIEFCAVSGSIGHVITHGEGVAIFNGEEMTIPNRDILKQDTQIFICHPVRHVFYDSGNIFYHAVGDPQKNNVREKFFAYFWQKGLLTEEQLTVGAVLLGEQSYRIQEEKAKLVEWLGPQPT